MVGNACHLPVLHRPERSLNAAALPPEPPAASAMPTDPVAAAAAVAVAVAAAVATATTVGAAVGGPDRARPLLLKPHLFD